MSNVKTNRTHSEHCDFKSELIRLLGLCSYAASLFSNVVCLHVECGDSSENHRHQSHRYRPDPLISCPDGPRLALPDAVKETGFFIRSHVVRNSEDDYIPPDVY